MAKAVSSRHETAIVTGGSRGLGRGIVGALSAHGIHVIALARDGWTAEALSGGPTTDIRGMVVQRGLAQAGPAHYRSPGLSFTFKGHLCRHYDSTMTTISALCGMTTQESSRSIGRRRLRQ